MFDLRSDTVTRPTPAMRQAMAEAEVGDDVYREDPTVQRLEQRTAALLGKPAALFVPSGTMANEIALLCHCQRGDEVLAGVAAHCSDFESGAAAAWSGVQFRVVGTDGLFTAAEVEQAIRPAAYYLPRTRLVVVENTHNMSGGRLFPPDEVARIVATARAHGLRCHLDGARLWNAAVAAGRSEAELAAGFDTVTVCFSKGLGAPVGSALCAEADTIERALRFRKMLGGGMRQAGVLAAAALHALEHHRARLAEDHAAARRLGAALGVLPDVETGTVETNMVNVGLPVPAAAVIERARQRGVLISATGPRRLRLVTHLDVTGPRFDEVIAAMVEAVREACGAP